MTLGQKIKYLRKKKGLTLEFVAESIGSSKGYMWEIENRPDLNPSVYKIKDIAITFGVDINSLLSDEPCCGLGIQMKELENRIKTIEDFLIV